MPNQPSLELIALLAALIGDALVLLFIDDPWMRLLLGLLLLAVIVWSSARIGVLDIITRAPVEPVYKRRFVRLRGQVQQLLDEIRRLNWMAVDVERGFRNRESATQEMDIIETRLKELIAQIRSTAGQLSSEVDTELDSEQQDSAAS
ncbi:MAG: hypothetical protein PVJ43_03465 [Gemmatimonadales bacterium]